MPLSRHQKINKQNKFRTSFFKTSALLLYHITSRINLAFCVPMYSLACYSPWTGKESDTTERLNWTERYSFQVKVKVSQSFLTLCDPMDCIVHGILQARILEWVVFPFSRAFSQPRDQTQVSHIAGRFFTSFKYLLCNHHHLLMGLKTCWKEQGPRSQGSLVLIPHTNYVPLVTSAPLLWTLVLSSVMGDNTGNPCLMA